MNKSKFHELLQDPDFKIWNIGVDYMNEEAIAQKKTIAPFDIYFRINEETVSNLQECNISILNPDDGDAGIRFNLVFHIPTDDTPRRFFKYVFNIDLLMKGLPTITFVEKKPLWSSACETSCLTTCQTDCQTTEQG